jgi:hypothetical protein
MENNSGRACRNRLWNNMKQESILNIEYQHANIECQGVYAEVLHRENMTFPLTIPVKQGKEKKL